MVEIGWFRQVKVLGQSPGLLNRCAAISKTLIDIIERQTPAQVLGFKETAQQDDVGWVWNVAFGC